MKISKIPKPGTTQIRKAFWDEVYDFVSGQRKLAGKNVSVDEFDGYGSIISVNPQRGGSGVAIGACCREDVCTIETQASCESDGGVYQGDNTDCDPNPCVGVCPCQPTHVSLAWTASNPAEPEFDVSYTAEVDIPTITDPSCIWLHTETRTVTAPCPGGDDVSADLLLEISLEYNFETDEWEIYIDEFITMNAFFCEGVYLWPDSVSLVATMSDTIRSFPCDPPFEIDEDLTDDAHATFAGHVTATFT